MPAQATPISLWLLCWMAFASVDGNTQSCSGSDRGACLASERRSERTVVFSDYGPGQEEDEQEDVDDADQVMHMQMRLNIELPLNPQADKDVALAVPQPQHPVSNAQKDSKLDLVLSLAGAAMHAQAASPMEFAEKGQQPPVASEPVAVSLLQVPASAGPDQAEEFLSGGQLVLGAGIGAALVLVGAFVALSLRTWLEKDKTLASDELRAAGKAWMLDWALGFDAEEDEETEPAQVESQLKIYPKKKQPPLATASDSGDTDEEEPEAESSDNAEIAVLEDAVYVAQQVEDANEAHDSGYGMERDARLVDQICDLT